MQSELMEIAERLAELTDGFDPAVVHADDAVALVDLYTRIERIGASGRALAAPRAAQAGAWRREGFRSPEDWLARRSGTGTGKAKKTLELGERLERHRRTREGFAAGRVSQDQAGIVTGAADENPDAEADLLRAAERESLKTLRQDAARAKAAVSDEEQRQAKIHNERYASGGTDEEGAYRVGVSIRPGLAEVSCSRVRWLRAQGLLAGLREQLTSSPERVASRAGPNAHTSSRATSTAVPTSPPSWTPPSASATASANTPGATTDGASNATTRSPSASGVARPTTNSSDSAGTTTTPKPATTSARSERATGSDPGPSRRLTRRGARGRGAQRWKVPTTRFCSMMWSSIRSRS